MLFILLWWFQQFRGFVSASFDKDVEEEEEADSEVDKPQLGENPFCDHFANDLVAVHIPPPSPRRRTEKTQDLNLHSALANRNSFNINHFEHKTPQGLTQSNNPFYFRFDESLFDLSLSISTMGS